MGSYQLRQIPEMIPAMKSIVGSNLTDMVDRQKWCREINGEMSK